MIFILKIEDYLSHYSKFELTYGTFMYLTFNKELNDCPISFEIFQLFLIYLKKFNKDNVLLIQQLYEKYKNVCINKTFLNYLWLKKSHCFDPICILSSNILTLTYYIERGYTEEFAKKRISELLAHTYVKPENLWENFINTYKKVPRKINKNKILRVNCNTGLLYTDEDIFKLRKKKRLNIKYKLTHSLSDIFFDNNGYILKQYVSYKIFSVCLINKNKVNKNNQEFISKLYLYYINIFKNYDFLKIDMFYSYNNFFKFKYKSINNVDYWLNRGYSEEESKSIISNALKNNSYNKKKLILMYGEDEGLKQYNIYIDKRNKTRYIHKINNPMFGAMYSKTIDPSTGQFYTGERLLEKRKEVCRKNFYIGSLKNAENIRNGKLLTVFLKLFWINKGFTELEAYNKIIKLMGKSNLEYYIEKYGETEGIKRFNQRSEQYKTTMNNKSDEEKLDIIKRKALKSYKVSKSSIVFFNELLKRLHDKNINFLKIYMNDNEYYIYDYDKKTIYFYDLCIYDIKLIIEYNGIKYHPYYTITGKELEEWKSLFYNISGIQLRERDLRKLELAELKGFIFLTVWDIDEVELSLAKIINNIEKILKQ